MAWWSDEPDEGSFAKLSLAAAFSLMVTEDELEDESSSIMSISGAGVEAGVVSQGKDEEAIKLKQEE